MRLILLGEAVTACDIFRQLRVKLVRRNKLGAVDGFAGTKSKVILTECLSGLTFFRQLITTDDTTPVRYNINYR